MHRLATRRLVALTSLWLLGLSAVQPLTGSASADTEKRAEPSEARQEPRDTMHRVFAEIAWLLPASLDESRWADPASRKPIERRLETLTRAAGEIEAHSQGQDVGFEFLSRSLASRLEETRERYARQDYDESRFLLGESVQTCVACHSRVPIARDFPLAERLVEAVEIQSLLPHERAQLLVVTRRPEQALAVWETLLADTGTAPEQLDIAGVLQDYLSVAVRVQKNYPRARKTLEKFSQRPDLPRYLDRLVDVWVRSLRELDSGSSPAPDLAQSRALVERARTATRWPSGREGLVYDLVASGLLHEYVRGASEPNDSVAEALYLLGLIEVRGVDSYWVPQASVHLEASIRMAPAAPFANSAYALLEEKTVLSYGGSGPAHLPPAVWQRLAELRGLIDATSPGNGR